MSRDPEPRSDALQRRDFIKASAIAAAAAIAGGTSFALPILADEPASGVDWQKAPCRFCGTGCHVQVGVQEGTFGPPWPPLGQASQWPCPEVAMSDAMAIFVAMPLAW